MSRCRHTATQSHLLKYQLLGLKAESLNGIWWSFQITFLSGSFKRMDFFWSSKTKPELRKREKGKTIRFLVSFRDRLSNVFCRRICQHRGRIGIVIELRIMGAHLWNEITVKRLCFNTQDVLEMCRWRRVVESRRLKYSCQVGNQHRRHKMMENRHLPELDCLHSQDQNLFHKWNLAGNSKQEMKEPMTPFTS